MHCKRETEAKMAIAYFDEMMDLWLKRYGYCFNEYFSGDRGNHNPPVWKNLKEIIFGILDSPGLLPYEFETGNLLKILPVVNFDRFIFRLLEYCKPLHDDYLKKVKNER